jgi:hypothetical protein
MTVAEKKEFEVACDAGWPEGPAMCVRDYAVACPIGWRALHGRRGDVECVAPLGCVCAFVRTVGRPS